MSWFFKLQIMRLLSLYSHMSQLKEIIFIYPSIYLQRTVIYLCLGQLDYVYTKTRMSRSLQLTSIEIQGRYPEIPFLGENNEKEKPESLVLLYSLETSQPKTKYITRKETLDQNKTQPLRLTEFHKLVNHKIQGEDLQ